jgi:Outer membrane protein beta-barrel domain
MKKFALSVLFSASVFSLALSQGISGGLRAGMNIANQTSSVNGLSLSVDSKIGLMAGAYLTIMTSDKFGIQPELVYSQYGSSATSNGQSISNNANYLSLPVMLRYNLAEKINLQAGPQLGILLSATRTSGSSSIDLKDVANGIDFGAAFGLGVDLGDFNLGARYYLGLSNLEKNSANQGFTVKTTNSAIQLFIGYRLFGK